MLERGLFPAPRGLAKFFTPARRRRGSANLLPLLIRVFAGFSNVDGEVIEADIDSSLGFLRYDYPEAWSPELQAVYQRALSETQNLGEIAASLSGKLDVEEKILLGIQLYVLISRARMPAQLLKQYYLFMTSLGVASEAVGIVYQLNAVEGDTSSEAGSGAPAQPLESLSLSSRPPADLILDTLYDGQTLTVFRFGSLILLKNTGPLPVIARGRQVRQGELSRLYAGQRVLLGEVVLDHQDFTAWLNAKKGVSSTQLFLALDDDDAPYVEKTRSRASAFQIKFGLGVEVLALKACSARVRGSLLRTGEKLRVGLHDKITFPNETEITLNELRRRAREMGGRFSLNPSKSDYLISTSAALLRPGDILLSASARGELLLRITCDYESKTGLLEVLKGDRPVFLGRQAIKEKTRIHDGATLDLGEGVCLRCHFGDRVIEEERNIISRLEIKNLSHRFDRRDSALDGLTISARRGELICVMGPSGCGKSTFMRILAGHLRPNEGDIRLNDLQLYENLNSLRPLIAYIPHEDAFDPLLTVEQNLDLSAAIRSPQLSTEDRRRRVDAKLLELGLDAARRRRAGTPEEKTLSGGERKRLNIGLDMISMADVFLFDEPTSGLSSKDSEHVLEIIRGLAHNKIVFVSIHQPSTRLFHMFSKALLLDKGGRPAFFGKPDEMLAYFRQAAEEEMVRLDHPGAAADHGPAGALPPEFLFDVLESPLRDLSGDVIYAEDERGRLAPARRFSPSYWRDRFQTHLVLREMRETSLRPAEGQSAESAAGPSRAAQPAKRHLKDEFNQFAALLRRAFLSKLRHRTNLVTTLFEAPILAVLIATVLRYPGKNIVYNFAVSFHFPTWLFLTLVVAMFLGLTNSADDVVRDRVLLERERNHKLRSLYYLVSKAVSLGFFALIQCAVYLIIGNTILEVRDMFFHDLLWMFLTSMTGVLFGLFISSIVNESKTATNLIPLILIPQIILGGALIKYEEMNRNLDLLYNTRRWSKGEDGKPPEAPNKLSVPAICEAMPLRWSYEALVISHARLNPITSASTFLDSEIQRIIKEAPPPPARLTPNQAESLRDAKDALTLVNGLKARNPQALKRTLDRVVESIRAGTFDVDAPAFDIKPGEEGVTATEIYINQKIWDLYEDANNERVSSVHKVAPNVFFGLEKRYLGEPVQTLMANFVVLLLFIGGASALLWLSLRRRLTKA